MSNLSMFNSCIKAQLFFSQPNPQPCLHLLLLNYYFALAMPRCQLLVCPQATLQDSDRTIKVITFVDYCTCIEILRWVNLKFIVANFSVSLSLYFFNQSFMQTLGLKLFLIYNANTQGWEWTKIASSSYNSKLNTEV